MDQLILLAFDVVNYKTYLFISIPGLDVKCFGSDPHLLNSKICILNRCHQILCLTTSNRLKKYEINEILSTCCIIFMVGRGCDITKL